MLSLLIYKLCKSAPHEPNFLTVDPVFASALGGRSPCTPLAVQTDKENNIHKYTEYKVPAITFVVPSTYSEYTY